jgi:hypothetical protein
MCFTNSPTGPKPLLHWKSIQRFRERVRHITRRGGGRSIAQVIAELMRYLTGWWGYFGIAESRNRLKPPIGFGGVFGRCSGTSGADRRETALRSKE